MRCITTTEQLISYLDSVADPAVIEHIDGCVECQRRARQLARSQHRFAAKLAGNKCPSTMRLGEYHLRLLNRSELEPLREHIRGCATCLANLNELAAEVGPPVAMTRQKKRKAKRAGPESRTTPFTSAIFYPKMQQAQMSQGLRGAAASSAGNLAASSSLDYMIDLGKISIRLVRSATNMNRIDITGLLLGVQAPFNKVTLLAADTDEEVASVPVNRLGGFTIEDVQSGAYDLELVAPNEFSVLLREFNI